jgi:leucyl-tRNA synthetase
MWEELGNRDSVFKAGWQTYDEAYLKDDEIEVAVQINGKTRGVVTISAEATKEEAIAAGKEVIADKLTGNIVKEIYVPGRIVNIVQK